jgi:RNA polymerase primary sigma factor
MATQAQSAAETKDEQPEAPSQDGPLLDLSDAAVKKMIKEAKKRGYVTVDELNSVLPSEEVTSEQIEDTMSMLSDMGINVVESDEQKKPSRPPPTKSLKKNPTAVN